MQCKVLFTVYVFSLRCSRSQPPHAAWDRACAASGPSTFWGSVSQWVSLRVAGCSYWLYFEWQWQENTRTLAELLCKSSFSQILLGWSPRWSLSMTWGFEFSAAQSVDRDDRITLMKHLVERKSKFPCAMLFLFLAQKQVQIWGRCFSSIVGSRSPNFAQRWILVYWNRKNRHFEFGRRNIWKWNFDH